jgi:RNA polymerase sigma-70 factor, ECF subfamily
LEATDAELVKAACGGDIDSFRQLYERYYATAVGIARARLGDQHLAEDVAQEAFATACWKLATLRDGSRFPEWLGTICRRTASKMHRSQTNGQPLETDPSAPEKVEDTTTARVHEAVNSLPLSAQEIVSLHYLAGLSYEEIARSLAISPQAVHGRLQRARRKLADLLKPNE